jgi:hypothetical protein
MALNVVGSQQWRGFYHFLMKKIDAWRCTRSRADGGIKVVKCDGMREEDVLWGSILFSCGVSGVD